MRGLALGVCTPPEPQAKEPAMEKVTTHTGLRLRGRPQPVQGPARPGHRGLVGGANSCEDSAMDDSKKCPFCAEAIKREAVVCRYCGRDLAPGAIPSGVPATSEGGRAGHAATPLVSTSTGALGRYGVLVVGLWLAAGAGAFYVQNNPSDHDILLRDAEESRKVLNSCTPGIGCKYKNRDAEMLNDEKSARKISTAFGVFGLLVSAFGVAVASSARD